MKKYMYKMPCIILLLANSFIAKGVTTLKNSKSRKDERKVPEKRSHKTFYEDYYQDVKVPTNYDLDYYPYRSYLYDSNEDPLYEEPHNIVKKHKTNRRGYKEKNLNSKNNHLNSQKVRIKSQRRSKTNFKTKSRRNVKTDVQSMDNSYFADQYLNNGEETGQKENYGENVNNIRRQTYLPSAVEPPENGNAFVYGNREEDGKIYNDNYTNNMGKQAIRQPEIIENFNLEGYKPSNKKSPYDYLHIYNRSHNNFNDINDRLNMKYEFQPNDFNYKSLKRVLGEPIDMQPASQFPQCPAYRSDSRNDAESVGSNVQKQNEGAFFKGNVKERINYNGALLQDRNYFRKRLDRSHEEYKSKSKKQNLRKKRGEKTNIFTLTFPGTGENLGSYISLRDWPTAITQNARCTKCTTPCTTCSTTQQCTFLTPTCTEEPTCRTTCTTECTTKCTTTEECTTEVTCATETKCTTCPRNFKELNEGGRIYMDLSNFVSNMFHPLPVYNATLNNNQQTKRQKYMVPYVLQPNTPSISSLNKNNEIKIIKLDPHNLIERSNNNNKQDNFNDNIYIVKLLKDLSSVGKLTEIPLQSQKSFYTVPYAPRVRRQLAIMKSVGDC